MNTPYTLFTVYFTVNTLVCTVYTVVLHNNAVHSGLWTWLICLLASVLQHLLLTEDTISRPSITSFSCRYSCHALPESTGVNKPPLAVTSQTKLCFGIAVSKKMECCKVILTARVWSWSSGLTSSLTAVCRQQSVHRERKTQQYDRSVYSRGQTAAQTRFW